MENKFINRYNTFCKSLSNLEKSKYATAEADFVLAATVQNFNLTFMLKSRNQLAYDYDGELALQLFHMITNDYYDAMLKFADAAKKFYTTGFKEWDSFV